jgi:hypothetical protein
MPNRIKVSQYTDESIATQFINSSRQFIKTLDTTSDTFVLHKVLIC